MKENKPLIKEGYEFYQGDIEDIRTGEIQNFDDSPAKFGVIFSGLALLACLVIVGLMGAIYHRDRTSITLSHLIMACIGVVIAGLCLFACFSVEKAYKNRQEGNHFLIGLALLMALVFFCYFLASAVYIFMYRPFHYGFLIHTHGNQKDWKDTFKGWNYEKAWGEDRRILWWVAFFCLVAAVGFLVAAISLWLLSRFPVQSAKMCLGAACFAGVLLGCFAIWYLWDARKYYENYALRDMQHNLMTALLVLIIIGIVLFFLNAVLNIFRKRASHFIFGSLLVIWVFVFVCVLGLILRDMRKKQFSQIGRADQCASILDSLHENDIKSACPQKYISENCSKQFLRQKWESSGTGFINPTCCQTVNNWLLWPMYICGCLCLLMITAALVAIAFNFYLSDKQEYLEFENKNIGLPEIIFAVLCVLALIAFAFYFGFRKTPSIPKINPNNPDVIKAKYTQQVVGYVDPDFPIVDLNKVYKNNVPVGAYLQKNPYENPQITNVQKSLNPQQSEISKMYTGNSIVKLKKNDLACKEDPNVPTIKCGWRLAVLATNAKLDPVSYDIKGTDNMRQFAYPDDNNSKNDFQFVFGTEEKLQAYLNTLKITPYDISKPSIVYITANEVNLSTINASGLKTGENPQTVNLSPNGSSYTNSGSFEVIGHSTDRSCYYSNSCNSTLQCFSDLTINSDFCQKAFTFFSSDGIATVEIPLEVLNKDGNRVPYNENTISSSSYYDYNGQRFYLSNVQLKNSSLVLEIPRPIRSDVGLSINLNDTADHYIPASEYLTIPVNIQNSFITDPILLLTKDGVGCVGTPDPNACFASKTLKYANIDVLVKADETGDILIGIPVTLNSGQTASKLVGSQETNKFGQALFSNAAFDYYTVAFAGNDTYLPASKSFSFQNDQSVDVTLFLHQRKSTTAIIEQEVRNTDGTDKDFLMNIKSIKGTECTVSPLNKWCAYSEHVSDVLQNENGFEKIKINKFTVSNYLTYLQTAPQSSASCGAYDINNFKYYPNDQTTLRSLEFDWDKVRKLQTTTIWMTLQCFNGWGLNTQRIYRTNGTGATVPSAGVCNLPDASMWSLAKLEAANNA